MDIRNDFDLLLVKRSCIYARLIAILSEETDNIFCVYDLCRLPKIFEDCHQNLLIKKIVESFKNENYEELEDLVNNLTINNKYAQIFCSRAKAKIAKSRFNKLK
ncbi:hypothetical protein RF11_11877 [Thelohanellus kitauei]|uniref:Uncharacterized protein n=1 Tax=Thelohanellus kitauei TaxID=669202 RepID=A0A0C2MS06_THEKT|nr:hypothetical protein RF11_11877 [Thelohanellus kitauei]